MFVLIDFITIASMIWLVIMAPYTMGLITQSFVFKKETNPLIIYLIGLMAFNVIALLTTLVIYLINH